MRDQRTFYSRGQPNSHSQSQSHSHSHSHSTTIPTNQLIHSPISTIHLISSKNVAIVSMGSEPNAIISPTANSDGSTATRSNSNPTPYTSRFSWILILLFVGLLILWITSLRLSESPLDQLPRLHSPPTNSIQQFQNRIHKNIEYAPDQSHTLDRDHSKTTKHNPHYDSSSSSILASSSSFSSSRSTFLPPLSSSPIPLSFPAGDRKSPSSPTSHHTVCTVRHPYVDDLDLEKLTEVSRLRESRYFIAINLFNCEELIPVLMREVLRLMYYLQQETEREGEGGGKIKSPKNLYLSVYESGSTDSTPRLLTELQQQLILYQLPHTVIVGGNITRATEADRIKRLARTRNAAMEPLYGMIDKWEKEGGENRDSEWYFDHVVFINDIYFCAEDMLQLLTHANYHTMRQRDKRKQRNPSSGFSSSSSSTFSLPYSIVCGHDFKPTWRFYDTWVLRDRLGQTPIRRGDYPWYDKDEWSNARLRQMRGIPVFCCWNGVAILNGDVFYVDKIRFRSGRIERSRNERVDIERRRLNGERNQILKSLTPDPHDANLTALLPPLSWERVGGTCFGSEMHHLCEDIWNSRASRGQSTYMLVDPHVQVAYEPLVWARLLDVHMGHVMMQEKGRKNDGKSYFTPDQQFQRAQLPLWTASNESELARTVMHHQPQFSVSLIPKEERSKENAYDQELKEWECCDERIECWKEPLGEVKWEEKFGLRKQEWKQRKAEDGGKWELVKVEQGEKEEVKPEQEKEWLDLEVTYPENQIN